MRGFIFIYGNDIETCSDGGGVENVVHCPFQCYNLLLCPCLRRFISFCTPIGDRRCMRFLPVCRCYEFFMTQKSSFSLQVDQDHVKLLLDGVSDLLRSFTFNCKQLNICLTNHIDDFIYSISVGCIQGAIRALPSYLSGVDSQFNCGGCFRFFQTPRLSKKKGKKQYVCETFKSIMNINDFQKSKAKFTSFCTNSSAYALKFLLRKPFRECLCNRCSHIFHISYIPNKSHGHLL